MVAVAVGLGSVDMPVPSIAEWEWLNWKFPRAVHAGDTVYARWTLTQKRPPVGGSPSSIVVWRVDVHTADGALCAEGEIGAKVRRGVIAAARQPAVATPTPARRRRRRSRSNGSTASEPAAPPAQPAPAPPKPAERPSGQSRRRRRRRPGGAGGREENHEASPAEPPITAVEPAAAQSPTANSRGISGVLRRLRGS